MKSLSLHNTKKKENKYTYFMILIDMLIIFLCILVLLTIGNKLQNLPLIGWLIIFVNGYICLKVRNNNKLFFLISIIFVINASLAVSDCILMGISVSPWQMSLRSTAYNAYTAKSILLFLGTLNLMLSQNWLKKTQNYLRSEKINRGDNRIIAIIGLIAMFVILIYGFITLDSISNDGYTSVSNPIYEYLLVVYCIVWFYSKKNKRVSYALTFFTFLYVVFFFNLGDRSSAFMMVLLYYILHYVDKLSVKKIIFLAIFAIVSANAIGVVRQNSNLGLIDIINKIIEKGIYIDTVSYSYHASIAISAIHHSTDNASLLILNYINGLFLGSNKFSNLAHYATTLNSSLFNYGGGIYSSYFYAWFGYPGVFFGGILLGIIIRKTYLAKKDYMIIYQVLIPTYCLRWYLYGPTSLFRGVLILTTILLVLCGVLDNELKNRKGQKKWS